MDDDAAIDAAMAAGNVPRFITAAFLKDNRITEATVGIVLILALTCAVAACRLLSRKFIIKRFGLGVDDGIMILSLMAYIAFAGLCLELVRIGGARHIAFYDFVVDNATYEKFQVIDSIAHMVYLTALVLCRVSGLAFYYRLCSLHKEFLITIRIIFGILIAGHLVQVGLIVFHCIPVTLLWNATAPDGGRIGRCLQWPDVYVSSSIISLVCDFLLFGIPVAMLWVLDMPRKQTIQVASILLPGVAVVGLSIARVISVYMNDRQTIKARTFAFLTMIMIENAEVAATLIALSIPGVKPLFDGYILRKEDATTPRGGSYVPKRCSGASDATELGHLQRDLSQRDMKKDVDCIYVTVDFSVEDELEKGGKTARSG